MYINNVTLIKTQPMIVHWDKFSIEILYIWTYIPLSSIYLKIMSIKINYSKKTGSSPSANLVLFSNEKFSTNGLKRYLSNSEFSYINDLLKTSDLKKNLFVFEVSSKKKNNFNIN